MSNNEFIEQLLIHSKMHGLLSAINIDN